MKAALPENEAVRLRGLHRDGILDTLAERSRYAASQQGRNRGREAHVA